MSVTLSRGTPGATIGTLWETGEIWLRRTFAFDAAPRGRVGLHIHHDEDATVYLNGRQAVELGGYTTAYETTEIDPSLLREWENVLAVRCRQTTGGQSIDAGLDRIIPAKP